MRRVGITLPVGPLVASLATGLALWGVIGWIVLLALQAMAAER